MTKEELWQAVLAQIQLNISPANFATWFKNSEILSWQDEVVVISLPNSFAKEWLEQKYNKMIFKILHSLDERIKEIKYTIGRESLKTSKKDLSLPVAQLEFPGFKVDKETNLNPRYTFSNFIVGSFNSLAHAAAQAVAQNPGSIYNPLFIYGGVGLGKTHLLQAIGNEINKNFPEKKVRYLSAEKFTSGVINSIRSQTMEAFKSRYREVDVLIIDDVQFLAGKEKTQEEFFHTFNTLYEQNKQIALSSDRPPKAIPALTERLRSRFEGGMIADIGLPDFETRLAILKAKSQERKINLANEILEYIATNIQRNIREMEGALNRLAVHQKLNPKGLNLETAKTLLKSLILSPSRAITPQKIIRVVAEFYELKEKELLLPSRKKEIVYPRQVAMYLLREELKCSYPFIGRKFGGKDHTTALHSCEKIASSLEKNKNLAEEIQLIKERLQSI